MFEKQVLLDEEGNPVTEKNGKPKMVKVSRVVKDNGWSTLSQSYRK